MQVSVDGKSGFIEQNGMVNFGATSHANVVFYHKSVLDQVKSRQESRPIFVSKEYVRIQHPGEADVVDKPISDDPRLMYAYPTQYQKFLNNINHDIPDGTPLEILFPNRPEIPANLHTQGVHTVEQLAELTAHGAQNIGMGAVEWQNNARKFLDSAKGGIEHHKLVKSLEDLRTTNEVLQNQLSLMKSQIDRLTAAQQGINPLMIPNAGPTSAQAHYASFQTAPAIIPVMQFAQDEPQLNFQEQTGNTYAGPFGNEVPIQESKPSRNPRKG